MRIFILLLVCFFMCELTAQISVDFTVNQTESCGSLQAIFTDNSSTQSSNIIAWEWDLAGVKSDREQPGRIFDTPGEYTICLTVMDDAGNTEKLCKEDFITIYKNPIANFKVDNRKGCAPIASIFNDLSIEGDGGIVNWIWDIGGSTNLVNTADPNLPINTTYSSGGKYSVSLSIEDENGCSDVISKKDFIEVFAVPDVILSRALISICELPWEIDFKNENVDLNTTYFWDFGNGQTYEGFDPPTTIYTDKGKFDLTIIAEKEGCLDTIFIEDYINTDLAFTINRSIDNPCAKEEILFSDNAEILVDSILWDFGDGSSSTDLNPMKSYISDGCFEITVTRYFGDCVSTETYPCLIINPLPEVQFTVENQYTCSVPIEVVVAGQNGDGYNWQMLNSDGIDQIYNPVSSSFTLTEFGQYNLSISYMDLNGCVNSESNVTIDIDRFSANLPSFGPGGCVPYNVELSDSISTNTQIISYDWTIPDLGFSSTDQKPSFMLEDTGKYDVILIVENEYGCKDTIIKENYVQGGLRPMVDFLATPLEGCLADERQFTSITSGNADFWLWDFGDGSFSTFPNPNHIYGDAGLYTVTLSAFHNGCISSETKEQYINILEPVSAYEIMINCDDPYTITLNNLTSGADSLYWFFDDLNGKQDTLLDSILTSYTFENVGRQVIGIYSKNDSTECEHIRVDTIEIVDLQPNYSVNQYQGCVPLSIDLTNLSSGYSNYEFSTDQAGATVDSFLINYSIAGVYTLPILTVEDIHGCIKTYQDTNQVFVNKVNASADFNPTVCIPDSVTINNTSSSLFGQINLIEWSFADATFTSDSLQLYFDTIGNFLIQLNATDDLGCKDSIVLSMDGISATPNFIADTLGCVGSEITFIPTNQAITISEYEWDFGDGNTSYDVVPKHAYDAEGTYTICLTIFDLRGCVNQFCKEDYIFIADPRANFDGFPLQEECPPLLSNFNNYSTNAISYEWDFGDNSGFSYIENPAHIYTEPGIYDVQLIAIRSQICKDTLRINEYVEVRGPVGEFSYDVIGNCVPLEVQLNANSDRYYQYYYDFGNGVIDSSQTLIDVDQKTIFYTQPGTYTPKLIIADAAGCKRTFSADPIEVNDFILDFSTSLDPLCDVPVLVNIENNSTSSTENINFEWVITQAGISSNYYDKNLTAAINSYGDYDVTLIGTTVNCIDTLIQSDFINVSGNPVPEIISPDIICENNTLLFVNNSNISNGTIEISEWSVDGTIISIQDSIWIELENGEHQIVLEVTSQAGCKSNIIEEISVLDNPIATLNAPNIICKDESANLLADLEEITSLNQYNWSNTNGILCVNCTEFTVSPGITTSYYYDIQNVNGCSFRDSIVLNVAPLNAPTVALSADTLICLGDEATLTVVNFNNDYTYNWLSSAVECISDCSISTVSPIENSSYIIEVQNEYGCIGLDTTTVDIETSIPDFLTDEKFICEGNTTDLIVSDINNPIWYDGDKVLCANCPIITVQPMTDKYFQVVVESDLGCIYTDSIKVNIIPIESVEAGDNQQICNGETIALSGQGIGDPIWSPAIDLSNPNIFSPDADPSQSQLYFLTMTKDECVLSDSVEIEVIYKVSIEALGDTVCYNEEGLISAIGDAYNYNWYVDEVLFYSTTEESISSENSLNFEVIGSRTTCENDTAYAVFFVHPSIEFDFEDDRINTFYNSRTKIRPIYDEDRNYSFEWTPAIGLSCDKCPDPFIKGLTEKTEYEILITDENSGCIISRSLDIRVKDECSEKGFFIPNIFSPNNDGANEVFSINAGDPEEFISINIFNRWGNVLFRSDDPNFTWDGLFNGQKVNPGVYIYQVNAYCPENREVYQFSGDITVIR